jgi:hypothetical protein
VAGNPARILRYVSSTPAGAAPATRAAPSRPAAITVDGVALVEVPLIRDLRGDLVAREIGKGFPFAPARCFLIFDVTSNEVRGEHAHRQCDQLLVCVRGSVVAVCDDGHGRQEFLLDSPTVGLLLPAMVWGTQYRYTRDAMLLVFASRGYEPDDYIRDYDQFLIERKRYEEARPAAGRPRP